LGFDRGRGPDGITERTGLEADSDLVGFGNTLEYNGADVVKDLEDGVCGILEGDIVEVGDGNFITVKG
jgi:hypothetical protein